MKKETKDTTLPKKSESQDNLWLDKVDLATFNVLRFVPPFRGIYGGLGQMLYAVSNVAEGLSLLANSVMTLTRRVNELEQAQEVLSKQLLKHIEGDVSANSKKRPPKAPTLN